MVQVCDLSMTLLSPTNSHDGPALLDKSSFILKPRLDLWNSPQSSEYYYKAYFQQQQEENPNQSPKQRRRKSVRFSRRLSKTKEYIHVEEFTIEEKEACWYPIRGVM